MSTKRLAARPTRPRRVPLLSAAAVLSVALSACSLGTSASVGPAAPLVHDEAVATVSGIRLPSTNIPWVQSLAGSLGWAINASDPRVLLKSTTGGRTWTEAATLPHPVYVVDFVTPMDGYLLAAGCASACTILEATRDGGSTWTPVLSSRQHAWTGLDFTSPTVGYVTGENGPPGSNQPGPDALWYTTDGGLTLTPLPDPCTGYGSGQGLSLHSGRGLLVCGGQPGAGQEPKQLYRTGDGGHHWTLVATAQITASPRGTGLSVAGYVGSLATVTGSTAFLALHRLGVTATTDGGRRWTIVPTLPVAGDLATTGFTSSQDGWAEVSQSALAVDVYVTTDGGKAWRLRYPTIPPINGIAGIGRQFYGLVPVAAGTQIWTIGGSMPASDRAMVPAVANFSSPGLTVSGRKWVLYGAQRMYSSDDGGRTWTAGKKLPTDLVSASFSQVSTGWCVVNGPRRPKLFSATDSGTAWHVVRTPFAPWRVIAEGALTAWVASKPSANGKAILWRTLDGGRVWDKLWALPSGNLVGAFAGDKNGALVSGREIWTTTDGGGEWTARTLPLAASSPGVEAASVNQAGAIMLLVPEGAAGQNSLWTSITHGRSWRVLGTV